MAFIWSLPSPLKSHDALIEKALFSYALSFSTLFWHASSFISPCQEDSTVFSVRLLLLYAARPSLFEGFHLSWRWSIACGTSASCWKWMWTRYLWSASQRSTNTHACTWTVLCLHNTMSRDWRWYGRNNKHSWTGGGQGDYHSISTDQQQYWS